MFQPLTILVAALPLLSFVHAKYATNDVRAKLTLPWGTYEAEPYGEDGLIALFKNVRFGKAPVGNLRFQKSEFPDAIQDKNEIQNNSFGPSCIQANLDVENPSPVPGGAEDEDCLFLDIYVPYEVLPPDSTEQLPVVVYIFGGAYVFGGKETVIASEGKNWSLYDGQGILDATDHSIVWVVANYRLGAYGWLAGDTVERNGTPNAALYDQRLVFQFVHDYIDQVNGDKNQVSAWGNSAGAGSIIHHLTAFQGDQQPLFSRAVLWSPAYQWAWDRQGSLENTYKSLAAIAGCGDQLGDLNCLRAADNATLKAANQQIVSNATALGLFPFGPAVDGSWVKMLPAAQFQLDKSVNCSSLIVSHVWNEAGIFTRRWVDTAEKFSQFLSLTFPGDKLRTIRDTIENHYPSASYENQQARLRKVLQDSTFVCNTRQLYDAYKGKIYVLQYNFPPATHGSDLLASTWHSGVDVADLLKAFVKNVPDFIVDVIETLAVPFARTYQRYFAAHALDGDPNVLNTRGAMTWEISDDDGTTITNALKAGLISSSSNPFFHTGSDLESATTNCDFWNKVAKDIGDLYKADDSFGADSDSPDGLLGLQVQGPRGGGGASVMAEL